MTNPSETRDSELALNLRADASLLADMFSGKPPPQTGAIIDRLREAADTIDRLTSTGEAVLRVPFNWIAVLGDARKAIASLPEDALGYFEGDRQGQYVKWPLRDELLSNIDKALADPAASPREGHVEVPVEPTPEWIAAVDLERHGVGHHQTGCRCGECAITAVLYAARALPHNQGETKP